MADKGPAFFYHPVIGALSPMMMDAYMKKLARPLSEPVSAPFIIPPLSVSTPRLEANSLADVVVAPSDYFQPRVRKPMTLLKTAICAVTGDVLPMSQMVRFVISPEGLVVPDVTGKLPGAFMWIKADRAIIQKAIWRNSFATHTRQNVTIPENLLEILENTLTKQAMGSLSLARRAGELIFGFTKAEETLRAHQVAVYVVAADAKDNGREKLERLAFHQEIPVLDMWSSQTLSAALGEVNVMHIMLARGGLAQNLLELETKLKAIARTTL